MEGLFKQHKNAKYRVPFVVAPEVAIVQFTIVSDVGDSAVPPPARWTRRVEKVRVITDIQVDISQISHSSQHRLKYFLSTIYKVLWVYFSVVDLLVLHVLGSQKKCAK